MQAKFAPGDVVATPGVMLRSNPVQMANLLTRHLSGDWGVIHAEDKAVNEEALVNRIGRLMSAYPIDEALPSKGHGDNTIWIITESDRSATTLLLPDEY